MNLYSQSDSSWWIGVVENRNDPEHLGRCKVRIFGYHTENMSDLPTDDLPWAIPMTPITSASSSGVGTSPVGPLEGTWVIGFFLDGEDRQQPLMVGTINGKPSIDNSLPIKEDIPANALKDSSGNVVRDAENNPIIVTEEAAPQQEAGSEISSEIKTNLPPLSASEVQDYFNSIAADANENTTSLSAGGGGGANSAGKDGSGGVVGSAKGGNGGLGIQYSISGEDAFYGGGGGGMGDLSSYGIGGDGGGGRGYSSANGTLATSGIVNTGGGGGGTGIGVGAAGNGGSGIIVVRYPGTKKANGGVISNVSGYTIHKFKSGQAFFSPESTWTEENPAPSGYYIAQNYPSYPSGYYWIKSPLMPNALKMYVDMSEEGGGYDFYPIENGISFNKYTDSHSGTPLGLDYVYPRSKEHWIAMSKFVGNTLGYSGTNYKRFFATCGKIYRTTKDASIPDRVVSAQYLNGNYNGVIMRNPQYYGTGAPDWKVPDNGRWWLRDAVYSEPNGNYISGGFLYFWSGHMLENYNGEPLLFDDGGSPFTGNYYLVSTNAKP